MVARLPGSSSGQRLLFHNLKGLRLSGWDRFNERRGCPHCPGADDDGGHAFHTMWRCPAAQQLWSLLLLFWQHLGLWTADDVFTKRHFQRAVFSLRLPTTAPAVWGLVDQRALTPDGVDAIHKALQTVWQQQVLATLQWIWKWRQSECGRSQLPYQGHPQSAKRCSRSRGAERADHGRGSPPDSGGERW